MVYTGIHESAIGDNTISSDIVVGTRIGYAEVQVGSYIFDSSFDFFERDHPSYVVLGVAKGINTAQVLELPHMTSNKESTDFRFIPEFNLESLGEVSLVYQYPSTKVNNIAPHLIMPRVERPYYGDTFASILLSSFAGTIRELYFGQRTCNQQGISMKLEAVDDRRIGPFRINLYQDNGLFDEAIGMCSMQARNHYDPDTDRRLFKARYFVMERNRFKKKQVRRDKQWEKMVGLDAAIIRVLQERRLFLKNN